MTRKETLLKKNYELKNTLAFMKKETVRTDLDEFFQSAQFKAEAAKASTFTLEQSNDLLGREIVQREIQFEIETETEKYYSTEEGKAKKEELSKAYEAKKSEFQSLKPQTEKKLNAWIEDFLGEHWGLYRLGSSELVFAIKQDGKQDDFVFGSKLELYFDYERKYYETEDGDEDWYKVQKFELNVCTMGNFSIQETSKVEDRAKFYIDLGKFLADADKTEELKQMLFNYLDTSNALEAECKNLLKTLNNPLNL